MDRVLWWFGAALIACLVQACSVVPPPDPKIPGPEVRQMVRQRASVVVVTTRTNLNHWLNRKFSPTREACDADGGSATPISPDGYFLTADHVLERVDGRNVFVMYGGGARPVPVKARVIWRSGAADLALLHAPLQTPCFFHWSAPNHWLVVGSGVIHGGIVTGRQSASGKLSTSLAPEGVLTGSRKFKLDIPLQPGDSGGPVVDAYGALVGINSAVEYLVPMETAFFVDSEASRPNTRRIDSLVRQDRARNLIPVPGE